MGFPRPFQRIDLSIWAFHKFSWLKTPFNNVSMFSTKYYLNSDNMNHMKLLFNYSDSQKQQFHVIQTIYYGYIPKLFHYFIQLIIKCVLSTLKNYMIHEDYIIKFVQLILYRQFWMISPCINSTFIQKIILIYIMKSIIWGRILNGKISRLT